MMWSNAIVELRNSFSVWWKSSEASVSERAFAVERRTDQ